MEDTELPMVTEVSPEQLENALLPMKITELGIIKVVSPVQRSKAPPPYSWPPMYVTELGMVTEVSPEQLRKADSPMEVTVAGIVAEVSSVQPLNALLPIDVTKYVAPSLLMVSGMTTASLYASLL